MRRTSRFWVSFLVLAVLVLTVGCAIIPQTVQDIINGFTSPVITPETIYVTATPKSPAPPAAWTPLVIAPCLYAADCPEAVDLDGLTGDESSESYEVRVPYDAVVKMSNGWVALDDENLSENLASIVWVLDVDGVSYYDPAYIVKDTAQMFADDETEYPGAWIAVTIKGFNLNEPHTVTIGYYFEDAVYDGWESFPQGFTSTITYTILPQELNYGAPSIKSIDPLLMVP